MGLYDSKRVVVKHETYKESRIEIVRIMRGARHCNSDHDITARICGICGKPIKPFPIFVMQIDGARIDDPIYTAIEAALKDAKTSIDQWRGESDNAPADVDLEDLLPTASDATVDARILQQIKQLGWGAIAARIIMQGAGK